jgi:Calx-beta domain/Hydrazine synthase alpha subunit middle domain
MPNFLRQTPSHSRAQRVTASVCTAAFALTLLAPRSAAAAAPATTATPFPILFVTQVPIPGDFTAIASVFGNHKTDMESVGRGGDLYIRYPDGSLKNLTAAAGYGVATGFQGSTSIAVREPSVHWSGTKALFSMVIGAPPVHFQYVTTYWQIYEITGLGPTDTPVITKVANQPATYNNVSPCYASDDRILFTSDRPRSGQAHLYPQLDEYEEAPTVTGIWSLDRNSADLRLLDHAPSGDFTPIVDSFGRLIFTRWDHLQRDQQADADAVGGGTYGTFNYSDESPSGTPLSNRNEVFPEPRTARPDLLAGTNLEGHAFNHFFPWAMNQDGTEPEVLNHIGRHELHSYFNRSINDDPNVDEFIAVTSGRFNPNPIENLLQIKESPTSPGTYYGIDAPEFYTHAAGQVVSLTAPPGLPADQIAVQYKTHRDTAGFTDPGDPPSPNHSGHYRNPVPLSDATVLVTHTAETHADYNAGTRAMPIAAYDFQMKLLQAGPGAFQIAGAPLTAPIRKTLWFWDPDVRVDYVNVALWQLDPVEVRSRAVPPSPTSALAAPEATIFTQEGVDPAQFREYLRQKGLALAVSRNVTTRDEADRQQPFNLRVAGGVQTIGTGGKIYDTRYMQFYQADQIRGLGGAASPNPGRRVLAQVMHAPEVTNPPNPTGPLGSVRVGLDGSLASLVPARRAMSWHLTDTAGVPTVRERYWLTFQPGEIRVCASCHGLNSRDQANNTVPMNPPEALRDFLRYWKSNLFVAASIGDVTVAEGSSAAGGSAVFPVTLSLPSVQTVTVAYATADGSAVSGTDYQATSGTLTFPPGTLTRTLTVPILGNSTDQGNRTFVLNLSNPVNGFVADGQAVATILDDDGPALSASNQALTEGNSGTTNLIFSVSLAGPGAVAATVNYATADLSATAGSDYVATAGTLTFPPGVVSLSVSVPVNGDTLDEPDEHFALVLSEASNPVSVGTGIGTIVDDDGVAASPISGLAHGAARQLDLAPLPGPVANAHAFVVQQEPRSSYEVVVDAVSGDLQPLSLQRLSASNSLLQNSSGSGIGHSRSLRWVNATSTAVGSERIAVASGGCSTTCGADDVYRLRFYETTAFLPRFNNVGSQLSVLILQNPSSTPVTGQIYFWNPQGALVGSAGFTLSVRGSINLNTTTVPGAAGQSGTITIAHDAPYGVLTGKTVSLDPSSGLSFDTPLVARAR